MRDYPHTAGLERFVVLHETADVLLDELTERYMVERRETKESLGCDALVRTVRLIPRTPTAAPLAIAFTDFPGVSLQLGRWWMQTMPACPCDNCDEDPAHLVEELRLQSAALVEGGLWERVRRGVSGSWFETRLIGEGIDAGREGPLATWAARDARRGGFAAPVQWAPWPRRC